jgi:hypothetical protein
MALSKSVASELLEAFRAGVPLQTFWQAGCEGMIGV